MGVISILVQALVLSCCCVMGGRRLMHYFQLESYQFAGFYRSVKRNTLRTVIPPVAMAAVGVAALALGAPVPVRLLLVALMAALLFWQSLQEKAKKPFVITERIRRLMAVHVL